LRRTWVENPVTATYILPWKLLSSIGESNEVPPILQNTNSRP